MQKRSLDVSVVIPVYKEGKNISQLVEGLKKVLSSIKLKYEILAIDSHSPDSTEKNAVKSGAIVLQQEGKGYGSALRTGFREARGDYIITMDGDQSHEPVFIKEMWENKNKADIIIASRYLKGCKTGMSVSRKFLSKTLNVLFSYMLSVNIKDLSSGFRMYNSSIFNNIKIESSDFDVLQEILVKAYCSGYRVAEVPFYYKPRKYGKSKAKLLKFAMSYIKTLRKLWILRNSIDSVDYDERAYYSKILPQRLWQRRRYDIIMNLLDNKKNILDIGCGSSKIIQNLPDAVAFDINHARLRYIKKRNHLLVNGDVNELPFNDASFDTIICSEVIEHVRKNPNIFNEFKRVLRKNGTLILGTPDYDKLSWRVIERIYGFLLKNAYADEHVSHYSYKKLKNILETNSFKIVKAKYVFNSELILKARKI